VALLQYAHLIKVMAPCRVLFLSSASIALPLLEALLADSYFEVQALICQPDKPAGRKGELKAPDTKLLALQKGIPVFQPERLSRDATLLKQFQDNPPDVLLTFAYGQKLSTAWLELAKSPALNVHTSLLPKYRGASPIQAALLNGDEESGLTLMGMVEEMDAGPIYAQSKLYIHPAMTAGALHDALAQLAAEKVPSLLKRLQELSPVEQNVEQLSFSHKIEKQDGFVDFTDSARTIFNRWRAYTPWPGLWTKYKGQVLKLLEVSPTSGSLGSGKVEEMQGRLFVGTGDGALELHVVQMEGRKPMDAAAFLRGQEGFVGSELPF